MIFVGNTNPVGSVVGAFITEAQLQGQVGTGWVLCDGRSVTGSAYATLTGNSTIPDARGLYLRGKNNSRADGKEDPAGDQAVGTYEESYVQGHTHAWGFSAGANSHTFNSDNTLANLTNSPVAGGPAGLAGMTYGGTGYTSGITNQTTLASATNPGSAQGVPSNNPVDTRPRTILLNWFIRIN